MQKVLKIDHLSVKILLIMDLKGSASRYDFSFHPALRFQR